MNASDITASNMASLQSAVSLAMLRKTMNQDADAVTTLLSGMSAANPAPARLLDARA